MRRACKEVRGRRWLLLAVCGVAALSATSLLISFDTGVLLEDAGHQRCPELPLSVHPSDVHFAPGLIEHKSWVEFPVPTQFNGLYAFCLDERLISFGGGELDFRTGVARFNLPTRWVDLTWLQGRLDGFRDPGRWVLRLAAVYIEPANEQSAGS